MVARLLLDGCSPRPHTVNSRWSIGSGLAPARSGIDRARRGMCATELMQGISEVRLVAEPMCAWLSSWAMPSCNGCRAPRPLHLCGRLGRTPEGTAADIYFLSGRPTRSYLVGSSFRPSLARPSSARCLSKHCFHHYCRCWPGAARERNEFQTQGL